MSNLVVREEEPGDINGIRRVNLDAFRSPGEAALVDALRSGGHLLLSTVADLDGEIVGHAAVSTGHVGDQSVMVLAPVAVSVRVQGLGIGKAVIRYTLAAVGPGPMSVLGDPDYYSRFGFENAAGYGVEAPFPTEPGALQLLDATSLTPGTLRYASPFDAD